MVLDKNESKSTTAAHTGFASIGLTCKLVAFCFYLKPSLKEATFITTKFVQTYAQIKIHRDTDCSHLGAI